MQGSLMHSRHHYMISFFADWLDRSLLDHRMYCSNIVLVLQEHATHGQTGAPEATTGLALAAPEGSKRASPTSLLAYGASTESCGDVFTILPLRRRCTSPSCALPCAPPPPTPTPLLCP